MSQGGDEGGAPPLPPASVNIAPVEEGAFAQPIRLTGNVMPDEVTILAAEFDGIVESIYVEEGDAVTTDTRMLQIRELPLRLDYERAEASAKQEAQKLAELRNGTRPEDVSIAKANWEQAKAAAETARAEFDRYESLLRDKSVSQSEYDSVRQRWETARATEEVNRAQYDLAKKGPREEVIAAQEAMARSSAVDADLAKDKLERSTVRAPYVGVVTKRYVSPGTYVGKGDPLFEFELHRTVEVEVQVPDTYFPVLSVGMEKDLTIDAYPRETFKGIIAQIIPKADMRSRSFPVKFRIDNREGRLATGMLARLVINVSNEGKKSVVIPRDAIVPAMSGPMVFRVDFKDGKPFATSVDVQTGRFFGEAVEVFGDLEPDQRVVVRGNERLQPGQPLQIDVFTTEPGLANVVEPSRFFIEDFGSSVEAEGKKKSD